MPITIADRERASKNIISALQERSSELEGDALIIYIYNQAIDDAAKFAADLAPHNPMASSTLYAVSKQIRDLALLER